MINLYSPRNVMIRELFAPLLIEHREPTDLIPRNGWDNNFGLMEYGNVWRSQRRMFHQHFNQNASLDLRPKLVKGLHELLNNILDDPEHFAGHII